MSEQTRARALSLIRSIENAAVVTIDGKGYPQSRIMWTAGVEDDFTTYFLSGRPMEKCLQISANPRVCAFWTQTQGQWNYAMIKGDAVISDDQSLRDRFWKDEFATYYPGGKTDPNYVVIVIKPVELLLMDEMKYPLERIVF